MPEPATEQALSAGGEVTASAEIPPADDWCWCGEDRPCVQHEDYPDDYLDTDDGSDLDPCNYCPHDNTRHRGDGCLDCGCDAPQ